MKRHKITEEERNQVYRLIADGNSTKEIAKITGLSIHTIRDMRQDAPQLPEVDPKTKKVPQDLLNEWDSLTEPYRERRKYDRM